MTVVKGGSFLFESRTPEEVFTREDISEEQQMFAGVAEEFMRKEVLPRSEQIYAKDWPLTRELLLKAGELDLLRIDIPESYGGMGLHFPSQDAFAIETQGAIQDRTQEHLGSSDVVIIGMRRALLKAIEDVKNGEPAPWVIRDPGDNPFADFLCTSGFIEDHEDGPSFCRRMLAQKNAAE